MLRLTAVALLLAVAQPAAAQTYPEPSSSIYLPAGVSPSSGLTAGWNTITPGFCYGFTIGDDVYVKLSALNNDNLYIQTRNPTAANAMMTLCATGKRAYVYSPDGLTWQGVFVSAIPGG